LDWEDAANIVGLAKQFEKQGVIVGTEGNSVKIGQLIIDTKDGTVTGARYFD
jgi:hypothetical protein